MIEINEKLIERLNYLKRTIFFEILEMAGRVFIIVDYDESVVIGKRGFLPEEKERGLVLVFNKRMSFAWQADALVANLVFVDKPEKCYIPINFITGVFSPDLRIQMVMPSFKIPKIEEAPIKSEQTNAEEIKEKKTKKKTKKANDKKVIDISKFRQKK